MKQLSRFQIPIGVGLLALSLSHWFPMGIHPLELLAAFAHFTMVLSCAIVVFSLWKKLWWLFGSSMLALILSATLVIPYLLSNVKPSQTTDLTIGQFNLYHHNPSPAEALKSVYDSNCDILSLQEVSSEWNGLMKRQFDSVYPYSIVDSWDNCCHGIGLYSKFPIVSHELFFVEEVPTIFAQIEVDEKPVTVISIHTHSPAFPNRTAIRNVHLKRVSEKVSKLKGPIIMVGDLNVVPWDEVFKRFISTVDLRLVKNGFQPTFPMELGLPMIQIDHVMHSPDLSATSCYTTTIPGSDHKGIIAGFHIE